MKAKVTVYLDPEQYIEIQGLAKLAKRPVSDLCRQYIHEALDRLKNQTSLDEFLRS